MLKYFYIFLIGLAFSCTDDEVEQPPSVSSEYFKFQKGFYQVYEVFEVTFFPSADPDTARYQLKVEIVDSFVNNVNETTYVIYRSKRVNSEQPWTFINSWSGKIVDNHVIISEGSIPYVKLVIGAKAETTWNGNAYNNLEADEYAIKSIGDELLVGEVVYKNVVEVEQEFNDDPIVYTDLRQEYYAPEAGLIYKETTQLEFCTEGSCNNQNIIIGGLVLKQSLVSYGVH